MSNTLLALSDSKLGTDTNNDNLADFYEARVLSATDYYAFGMSMKGRSWQSEKTASLRCRYGFNGKENDGDWEVQDYGFRIYKPELGKFLSVDPLSASYPWNSAYAFAENSPIENLDLDGGEKLNFRAIIEGQYSTIYLIQPTDEELNYILSMNKKMVMLDGKGLRFHYSGHNSAGDWAIEDQNMSLIPNLTRLEVLRDPKAIKGAEYLHKGWSNIPEATDEGEIIHYRDNATNIRFVTGRTKHYQSLKNFRSNSTEGTSYTRLIPLSQIDMLGNDAKVEITLDQASKLSQVNFTKKYGKANTEVKKDILKEAQDILIKQENEIVNNPPLNKFRNTPNRAIYINEKTGELNGGDYIREAINKTLVVTFEKGVLIW